MDRGMIIDILIPAYNEEKNIENLLNNIKNQTIYGKVSRIWIISDASTDKTHQIIKQLSKNNKKIKLVIKEKRIGKFDSLNKGFELSNADFLIMLDADISFEQNYALEELIKPFPINKKIGLTSLKKKPLYKKLNYASTASLFSFYLTQELIKSKKDYKINNFLSVNGCAIAIIKNLYKKIRIQNDPGDDQHLFFLAIEKNYLTCYIESAEVCYKVPYKIKDWLKQNIRFKKALEIKKSVYGEKTVFKNAYKDYNRVTSFLLASISHPISCLAWIPLYFLGIILNIFNKKQEGAWEVAKSTK